MKNVSLFARSFIVVLVVSFLSCGREDTIVSPSTEEDIFVKNGRLTFKDTETFLKTLKQFQEISTEETAAKWESKYNYNSLRKYNSKNREDSKLGKMDLPVAYRTFLNEDCEYVVGKTIAWFNNGYVHYVENQDETLLEKIKSHPELHKNKQLVISKVYPISSDEKTTQGTIGHSGLDARYQHEWAINCSSGPWRKTVYELVSVLIPITSSGPYYYSLYVQAKLEWWSPSNGWQANAGEYRDLNINISGTVGAPCGRPAHSFNKIQTYYTNSTVQANLAEGTWSVNECSWPAKDYTIYGFINSQVYINGTCNGTLQTESHYEVAGYLFQ